MKDVGGTQLRLGDKIATTTGSLSLQLAEVVGFTPKMVRVRPSGVKMKDSDFFELKTSSQVCFIERNPAREEELSKPATQQV